MVSPLSDEEFSNASGVESWRVLFWGAKTAFPTGDFATGARLVAAIADQVAAVGHSPMIDLRDDTVTVQVLTIGAGLTDLDLELARRISTVAAEMGIVADPSRVSQLEIAIDARDRESVADFWSAALGYVRVGPGTMVEPNLIGPTLSVHEKDWTPPRNRIHIDVSLPHDEATARVNAVLAAGGRMLGDRHAPAWWSLIDAEGNVVDIATWQGRDE
ncbi:4a-hydroxytetrahydrobiopterin dehydratase [Microbacterium sp. AK009]|uniref:VOC family protein n=1 Tax=Microbacterium sp. AK009 TaxID=2723068 RepID=UPI0015CAD3A4|nr:VOC family protein [Microbacterium sp. AK009]NYF15669.1 4a-hydroxytetrahydrobiopterin dehydratase [Microbacterium sp. AK009]